MSTATVSNVITLRASDRAIVDGYSVKNYKSIPTRDGVAFSATLYKGTKSVGMIENSGRGGGTWFRPDTAEARVDFENWVQANKDAGLFEDMLVEEAVLDALVDEFETSRYLKRNEKKAYLLGWVESLYGYPTQELGTLKPRGGVVVTPTTLADLPQAVIDAAKQNNAKVWGTDGWITLP